jgi:predicted amidohydrolase YtcJ
MAVHHTLAAELLLINGRVLTMDVHDSVAQAVAVRDGKIVAVGTNAEVEPLAGASSQVIDLDGRTAMPGLTDGHIHLASDSSRSVESDAHGAMGRVHATGPVDRGARQSPG